MLTEWPVKIIAITGIIAHLPEALCALNGQLNLCLKEVWVRLSPRQVQRQAASAAARQMLAVSEEVHGEVSFEATGWHGVSCCPEV